MARRGIAAVVTGCAFVVVAVSTPASGAPVVSAAAPTRDWVQLLVGSPHEAVFDLTHYPPGSDPSLPPPQGEAPYSLVARAADGSLQFFPAVPGVNLDDYGRWTLADAVLAARNKTATGQVLWWNLENHTSGSLVVPADSFVAAAPSGVLFLAKNGTLKRMTLTGQISVLGRPFRSRPDLARGFSNGRGVVIGAYRVAKWVPFAHPSEHRSLDLALPHKPRNNYVKCDALSRTHAACTTKGHGRDDRGVVTPLDGQAATRAHDPAEGFPRVGLIGRRTLAWTRVAADGAGAVVATVTAGSDTRTYGSRFVAFGPMISAYHEVLVMPPDQRRILATDDATTYETIFTAPYPPSASGTATTR